MTVFIKKGDAPMNFRQAIKRGLRHFESEKMQYQREQGMVESDPIYMEWANQWVHDNQINSLNNHFNHQLYAYKNALKRLEKHIISEGRAEILEDVRTGLFDENGDEIMESVVVQHAIEPLPETINITVYDEESDTSKQVDVPNPEIIKDNEERAYAQSVIDTMPDEVKNFDGE